MNSTKIVISVERTACSSLSGLLQTGTARVQLPESTSWEKIVTRAHPSLQISEKIEDKVPLFTATLKFFTCQDMPERGYYAWRLRLSDGSSRLIGSAGRPYPLMTVEESAPEKPSDNQWNEVTVTWSSQWQIPFIG